MSRLHWEQLSPTENSHVRNVEASLGTTITYRKQPRQKCRGFIGNNYHLQKTVKLPRQKCRVFIGNNYHLQKTVKHVRNVEASLGTTITYRKQ